MGTPSRVSVCSAVKGVVITRWSTIMATVSTTGITSMIPGPLIPMRRPTRRITALSHSAITWIENRQ